MLRTATKRQLPLYIRSLALLFTGIVLALLGLFMPTERASAGESAVGDGYVFPLPSKHEYGDGFGAGRGHEGQDLFAKCGRNLVAANDGKVQRAESDGSGYGNILVLDVKGTGVDLLYAHMQKKPSVREGERVTAGQKVGKVGDTGSASGCHLHFEMHTAPGFWEGGHAMRKVTKYLKDWDKTS
ncbi:MAG TPA: M23 family metallopeptidase [Solirubrobacterales bacterium]|nr:M23 family metallopeptidase [Solirubrobacterales bacterium]